MGQAGGILRRHANPLTRRLFSLGLAALARTAPAAAKPLVLPEPLASTTAVCRSPDNCTLTLRQRERSKGELKALDLTVEGMVAGPRELRLSKQDEVLTWTGAATVAITLIGRAARRWQISMLPATAAAEPLPPAALTSPPGAVQWGAGEKGAPVLRRGLHGDWQIDHAPAGSRGLVIDSAGAPIGTFRPSDGFRLGEPLLGDGRVWVYDAKRAWSWPLSPSGQLDAER